MSERNSNSKRDAGELESSNASVTPLKKKKLDDSSADSLPSPSMVASSDDSSQGGYSVSSTGEDENKSSIICYSSESNENVRNNPTVVVDLETHQISETEASTSITSNFRKEALGETTERSSSAKKSPEVSKSPTPAEIEEFLSELESKDQKRFIDKYNFDIVNDKPLQGRYKWDRFKS